MENNKYKTYRVIWTETKSILVRAEDPAEAEELAMDAFYEYATLMEQDTEDIVEGGTPVDAEKVYTMADDDTEGYCPYDEDEDDGEYPFKPEEQTADSVNLHPDCPICQAIERENKGKIRMINVAGDLSKLADAVHEDVVGGEVTTMKATKFKIGDVVHWSDPDGGLCSGEHRIKQVITSDGEASVYLLTRDGNETEALERECIGVQKSLDNLTGK